MSQSDHVPAATDTPQRDAKGRFAKGNAGGPGNPYARQVAALRMELLQRCTPQRIGRIADKMMDLAEQGDVQAAKLIFQYVLGKPAEAAHPDRLDIDEVQVFQQGACRKDVLFPSLLGGMPADVSADFLREMTPIVGDIACAEIRQMGDILRAERAEKAAPTVTKRTSRAQSLPDGDWSDAVPAEAEAPGLLHPSVTKRPLTGERAANHPLP